MSLTSKVVTAGIFLGLFLKTKQVLTKTADKFNISMPISRLLITRDRFILNIDSVLVIDNHSDVTATLDHVRATISGIDEGKRTVLLTSIPSSKIYKINPQSTNDLQMPTIKLGADIVIFNALLISRLFTNPASKLEVKIEGQLNGF